MEALHYLEGRLATMEKRLTWKIMLNLEEGAHLGAHDFSIYIKAHLRVSFKSKPRSKGK